MIRAALLLLMSVALPKAPPQPRPRIISQQVYTPDRCDPKDPLPCQGVIVQVENPLADDISALILCENVLNSAIVSIPAHMRVVAPVEITIAVHGAAPCFIYSVAR